MSHSSWPAPRRGNYATLKRQCRSLGIDVSHFTGQAWNRNQKHGPRRPLSDYLSNQYYITSYKLQKRLIREGIFEVCCQSCGLTEWMERPIPLELHHVDGNSENNALENLRIYCLNCHALTENFRGTKKKKADGGR